MAIYIGILLKTTCSVCLTTESRVEIDNKFILNFLNSIYSSCPYSSLVPYADFYTVQNECSKNEDCNNSSLVCCENLGCTGK